MAAFSAAELKKLKKAAALLLAAEDRLPVLRTLTWDRSVGDAFLKSGGETPPAPLYPAIDPKPSRERIAAARALIAGSSPVHDWLRRFADTTETTAALLSAIGTKDFHRRSIALNRDLQAALSAQAPFATVFPMSGLAQQMQVVARMIAARSVLGVSRQIFFVSTGGYDTHSSQAPTLSGLHTTLAGAMRAFYDATVELGVQNDVTAFTASDFGRTLAVNGDGTDHGWGAHHFVVGGAVNGNRIVGDVPPPVVNHDQDSGSGRLIPTLAVEQLAASLAAWFGLTAGEIQSALPNLGSFAGPIDLFNTATGA